MSLSLVASTPAGMYCAAGDFHIDPWEPVDRAVITHAHADHAVPGCARYLTSSSGAELLRIRLGPEADIRGIAYGERLGLGGVSVSLHPAGHILGSAQVRLERGGGVCVISGDYKVQPDATCEPFELVRCHTFLTESTFGLPIYRWREQAEVLGEINDWWRANQQQGWTSVLLTHALGKAQRVLAGLDASIGPILAHGAVRQFLPTYRAAGVRLPEVLAADPDVPKGFRGRGLVIAPPLALGSAWLRRFVPFSTGMASGWMQIRGVRRRLSIDRGFVLSDHADWPSLLETIAATGAERVGVTHGYAGALARWLSEHGRQAWAMQTRYAGDEEVASVTSPERERGNRAADGDPLALRSGLVGGSPRLLRGSGR